MAPARRKAGAKPNINVPVPILDTDGNGYDEWKRDVRRWCKLSKKFTADEKALMIHLSLEGTARTASGEIPDDEFECAEGVENIFTKLDNIFLPDKMQKQFDVYKDMHTLRKDPESDIHDYVNLFEQKYHKFRQWSGELTDPVLGFMLLISCNLTEEQEQTVRAGLINGISFANMKSTLKRIFGKGQKNQMASTMGNAPTSSLEVTTPTFYAESSPRGRRRFRGRGSNGGRYPRSRSMRGRGSWSERDFKPYNGYNLNPVGKDGKINTCVLCRSLYHYVRQCPQRKYSEEDMGYKKVHFTLSDNDPKEDVNDQHTGFTGFVGCTSNQANSKLSDLVYESRGYAILDSGCSNTVCGETWEKNFIKNLSDSELKEIKVENSNQSFTFGDGRSVTSIRKVTMPCWMGGQRGTIITDVVECNIPLLLSRRTMKRVGMKLDFRNDVVNVNGRDIKLKVTKSGHYALPLSL